MKRTNVLVLALLAASVPAQPPPTLVNTTQLSFTAVAGDPWIATVWGYTNPQGNFLLVCRGNLGLDIFDVTNPSMPAFASHINATGSDLKDVKTYQNYAYCVQQSGTILVVDLTNPYAATVATSFTGGGHTLFIEGTHLYHNREGSSPDGVEIWNLANPIVPVLVGSYDPPNFCAHDCFVRDNILYVSNPFGTNTGTHIVDITNKASPVFIANILHPSIEHGSWMYDAPGGRKILAACNEGIGGHLRLFDVTTPATPVQVGSYQTTAPSPIHIALVFGRYAYVAYYFDYLRILDLANPATPVEVGVFDPDPGNTGGTIFGVYGGAWSVYPVTPTVIAVTESFQVPRGFWMVSWSPPPVFDLDLSLPSPGSLTLNETGATPNGLILNAVSGTTNFPFGQGPFFGLGADALNVLSFPLGTAPFLVFASATGTYTFSISGLPTGITFDLRGGTDNGGLRLTEVARISL